jgi:hypothetical protein
MRVLGVVALLIIAASTAHADDRSSAREHFVKGTKAFELGLYDEAINWTARVGRTGRTPSMAP